MNISQLTHRFCFRQIDELPLKRFLLTQKEELLLDGETAVQKVIDTLFEHGGILASFTPQQKIVAILGFFFGDPKQQFENKDLMFLYVAALAKPYRMTRLFHQGMLFVMNRGQEMGMTHFRMQANINDPYVNKLYSRMGKSLGQSKTLRGHPVMAYGGSIDELVSRYSRNKQTLSHRLPSYSRQHAQYSHTFNNG